MDEIDKNILRILGADGRTSIENLAQRAGGITPRLCRYRLLRLFERDIVRVSVVVNPSAVGMPLTANAMLRVSRDHLTDAIPLLFENDHVSYISLGLGSHQINVEVRAKDGSDLSEIFSSQIGSIPGIEIESYHLLPKIIKGVGRWDWSSLSSPEAEEQRLLVQEFHNYKKITPSRLDRKIVNCLLEDGRMKSTEIARRIFRVDPRNHERFIRRRIDAMIQGGIIRIATIINPETFGYRVIADCIVDVKNDQIEQASLLMAHLPQINFLAGSLGGSKLIFQAFAKNNQDMFWFINEKIRGIKGVSRTEIHMVARILKGDHDASIPLDMIED